LNKGTGREALVIMMAAMIGNIAQVRCRGGAQAACGRSSRDVSCGSMSGRSSCGCGPGNARMSRRPARRDTSRRGDVRLGFGFGTVQSLRSIQRPSAGRAHAKDENTKINRPNAQLLHPVNNLSTFGSRAARSPLGSALRSINL
jgi:hypothetical protein